MDEKIYFKRIQQRYGHPHLSDRLFAALRSSGVELDALHRDHLRTFDEFHLQARSATLRLAGLASIRPGATILDLGCGVGGPARTLAAEYGADVTGLDLSVAYIRAAQALTAAVRSGRQVRFMIGDMHKIPSAQDRYEVVWIQHALMNVPDKPAALREVERVLQPKGRLAVHEILSIRSREGPYPLPWADDRALDHLCSAAALRDLMGEARLEELAWEDLTQEIIAWGQRAINPESYDRGTPLGIDLVIGEDFRERTANLYRALQAGDLQVIMAVYQAP